MQIAGAGDLHIEKKGTIDLVTEIDKQVEQMFRALIGERFPDHAILAEEFGGAGRPRPVPRATAGSSIPSTAPPTTRTVCRFSARPARSSSTGSRSWRRSTIRAGQELFTAERGAGRVAQRRADARLDRDDADRRAAMHGISLQRAGGPRRVGRACSASSSDAHAPSVGWDRPPSICATSRPDASMASGSRSSSPGTCPPGRCSWRKRADR